MKYHVIFRTCDQVFSVNSLPRPFCTDKLELIKVCFLGLVESLREVPHAIYVLADRISPPLKQFFGQFPVTMVHGQWGNDASIRQSLELGLSLPNNDWAYFCEDDYLHQPHTFRVIDDLIRYRDQYMEYIPRPFYMRFLLKNFQQVPLVIHPPDYPDRYKPKQLRPSFLFLSNYCHWRQVTNTTFTFLLQVRTLKKYKKILYDCCQSAKDRRLSRRLYARLLFRRKALCLSPIPGLACHMHESVFTPLVDWEKVYDRKKKSLLNRPRQYDPKDLLQA